MLTHVNGIYDSCPERASNAYNLFNNIRLQLSGH